MRSRGSHGEVVRFCWLPGLVQEPARTRCRLVAAIVSALLKMPHTYRSALDLPPLEPYRCSRCVDGSGQFSLALTPLPVNVVRPVCGRHVLLIKSSRTLLCAVPACAALPFPPVGHGESPAARPASVPAAHGELLPGGCCDNRDKTASSEARWQKRWRLDAPTIKHEIAIRAAAYIPTMWSDGTGAGSDLEGE
jgi:hypothetical protein